ncbi:alpha-N-acetylglucosaminidase [Verrucomicrobiaceae bacterium N1E253]|uniref:Alpha-N-acetylglucosaminidase n=1 Tax=Oceaniferula marina TaxID=2748318 RepID=A0A851GRN2_9BACT|nr:alpha-N-acetylglucosaminidase [Oceaniferula marina]NWK57430.1 alpha-N-acetylglucosaminidase [Oceaniferula marina]
MNKLRNILTITFSAMAACMSQASPTSSSEQSSHAVIKRLIGDRVDEIQFANIPKKNGHDVFEYEVKNGVPTFKGSCGVAICRGFYDYLKANEQGQVGWSGSRIAIPEKWSDTPLKKVVSPYKYHYYFNVVTYGYTTPYWDWERWEKELDWMALHGLDMPLALVANEAISMRVWKKLGLTQEEVDAFYTGPAHLPWQRMGNITGIDGPLNDNWHKGQVELQHKVLKRMRELGMKPICPAFAGFVPRGMQRLHPEIKFFHPSWAGFPEKNRTSFLLPDTPLFGKIGKMFIEEWEKEFGKCEYYLADCFNEMDIPAPKDDKEKRYQLLAHYGDQVYRSIKAGNPEATWVMQGWMFGYTRNIWDYHSLEALVSKVPDDKMILLDLAADYNKHFWKTDMNWDFYKGFYNKKWVYSVIPNMGGKTGLTGRLDFYASGSIEALNSKNKGRLAGFGFAPEGIENNEVIYELLSDMGWRDTEIDLDVWLNNYSASRYGTCPPEVTKAWNLLRKTCYGTFTDHPRFNWQFRPGKVRKGSINTSPEFQQAIETFAAAAEQLKDSPNYRADLIEFTAMYVGIKVEQLFARAMEAEEMGYSDLRKQAAKDGLKLLKALDTLLESHPTLRLSNWVALARKHGTTAAEKDLYEANAKDLVTIWGGQIGDYSARIWSGLIRDYYVPRWKHYFDGFDTGTSFDMPKWEKQWTRAPGLTKSEAFENPVEAAIALIKTTKEAKVPVMDIKAEAIGGWTPAQVGVDWKTVKWNLPAKELGELKGVRFNYTRGQHRLEIRKVSLIADGKTVATDEHMGIAGIPSKKNFFNLKTTGDLKGNNECYIKAEVRSDGGNNSYGQVELVK